MSKIIRKKTIHVTAADIKKGNRLNGESCPIARAVKRAFPGAYTDVGGEGAELGWYETSHIITRSRKRVGTFVDAFDEGKPVKPFSFVAYIIPDAAS